jgi:dTDP-4-dehydrorhamnose 3,5-epimerase
VTSETAEVMYKCTSYYAPEDECSIRWDDATIGIEWPLIDRVPVLSKKDERAYSFPDAPEVSVGQ